MGALGVVGVGHIKVAVHIAVAVRDLFVDVSRRAADRGVELIGDRVDVRGSHQHRGVQAVLLIGVKQRGGVEGLMIPAETGVDDRDLAAGAGVAGGPGVGGAGLHGAGAHVGLVSGLACQVRLVAILDDDVLDAGNGLDGLDVPVTDVGGDRVHRQREVPLHVQRAADGGFDLRSHCLLLCFQAVAVSLCSGVVRDVLHAVAGRDGGGLVQHD